VKNLSGAPLLGRLSWPGVEKLAGDKHSSLLGPFVKYGRKKFHTTTKSFKLHSPRACTIKLFTDVIVAVSK